MKEVISASRRTDLPAFYLERLAGFIQAGYAEVRNPVSGKIYRVDMDDEHVHTIVFWSKNFRHFLARDTLFKHYRCYFLFTINNLPDLEPMVPSLKERLDQLLELAQRYGPKRIAWRFDPVVFRTGGKGSYVQDFFRIGEKVAKEGVTRVIFSFLDFYAKVQKRNELFKLDLYDPTDEVKVAYAERLSQCAGEMGLTLESCCEEVINVPGIRKSSCINGSLLSELAGEPAPLSKDAGQRRECACTVSRDIGSYSDMPCPGGCLYCYANPRCEPVVGSAV